MFKYLFLLSFITAFPAFSAPKLQDSDFATSAQITGAGGSVNQLLNSSKMYNSVDAEIMDTSIARWNAKLSSPVSLTTQVSGILPLANGGTNNNLTATNGGLCYSDASKLQLTAAGTSGQLIISQGAAAPTWNSMSADATISSSGVLTLATVNGNVGSFGSSTAIPNFTVNAKGLITAAGTNVVVAPAGTLTGTTLASNVVTSSLTTVGTIGTGVWNGTAITVPFGGTGDTSFTAYAVLAGGTTSTGALQQVSGLGTSGQVLTSNGAGALPTWQASGGGSFVAQTSSTGSGVSPSGTTAQRDASPVSGYFRYNSDQNTEEFYNNGFWFPLDLTKSTNSATFTSTGAFTWTVPTGVTKIAVVVVGGGSGGGAGAGAGTSGAGGAGGGVTFVDNYAVIPGSVIRGSIGTGGTGAAADGSGGGGTGGLRSYFGSLGAAISSGGAGTTAGGGSGATGNAGGSSVNQASSPFNYNNSNSVAPLSSFGYFLGGTAAGSSGSTELSGGGAGAMTNGGNAVAATSAGDGGAGVTLTISGSSLSYAGGGGGGSYGGGKPAGAGGTGGGGAGNNAGTGSNATANSGGGGGGGGGASGGGGNGGSGFVGVYWYL